MRLFTARRLALTALAPLLLVLSVVPGCAGGSEGERCGDDGTGALNDGDCASGLTCTSHQDLLMEQGVTNPQDRCCYTDHVTDSRCAKTSGTSATGSTSGGASGSQSGAAGSSEAGAGGMSTELAGAGGA